MLAVNTRARNTINSSLTYLCAFFSSSSRFTQPKQALVISHKNCLSRSYSPPLLPASRCSNLFKLSLPLIMHSSSSFNTSSINSSPTEPKLAAATSSASSNANSPSHHSKSSSNYLNLDPLTTNTTGTHKFKLSRHFIDQFHDRPAPFGFNGLGELVYRRTYSRKKADGSNEAWFETVERVVNGTYNMQKRWIEEHGLGWNSKKAQKSAQEMYTRIFEMKFLPPGRGLWAMGSPITEQRAMYAALNNCAFVSTEFLREEPTKPFTFLMDASMLGVGVGFDTKGAGSMVIKGPSNSSAQNAPVYSIPDSREGWVEALRIVLDSFFLGKPLPSFDYSQIRPYGTPIKGFGGLASGPGALKELVEAVSTTLSHRTGSVITVTDIVDIMNFIGRCVVAGNVRRTAEIAFGEPNSLEYLDLKNYSVNPHRAAYGWTSNNSIFAELGQDYSAACDRIRKNGEPGFAWLDNMQNYARMNGKIDSRDQRARGGNPCLEQTLESFELCCLVETFPAKHSSKEDFLRTLKFAYLYAKTVTLGKTQWPETNRVLLRNRRIGTSVSGIAQFIAQRSIHELQNWLEEGYDCIQRYDQLYSDWLAIPKSIKTTSVKPSGTVSLLAGATPGMHYPESRYYLRRVRLSNSSELLAPLKAAGYTVEPVEDGDSATVVVEIPIDSGENVRVSSQVSMWEQLSLASFLQRYWADNQVSCTVTFDPKSEGNQLESALNYFQYQLKGISFLPRISKGAYKQMPYEEISAEEYHSRMAALLPLHFSTAKTSATDATPDRFCDGDSCATVPPVLASGGEGIAEPTAETAQQSRTAENSPESGSSR
jgi:ribonucleoside-triphosphate reductase